MSSTPKSPKGPKSPKSTTTINRSHHLTPNFVISCGTIPLDPRRSLALLIRSRRTHNTSLPKGRKNIAESLLDCALRETLEETGYRARALHTGLPTLATVPAATANAPGTGAGTQMQMQMHTGTEPVAVTQRPVRGVLKIIFWFAASVDSEVERLEGVGDVGDEELESVWVPWGEVAGALSFEDDRAVAGCVIDAVRGVAGGE